MPIITDKEAAIRIQRHVRGHLARKKYGIKQAPKSSLTEYKAFLVGNEPIINLPETYKANKEKIALVGTSVLRSLYLICQLGNRVETPKLIIIDNSEKVLAFWRKLRDLIEKSIFIDETANNVIMETKEAKFLKVFSEFLAQNTELYHVIPDNAYNEYQPLFQYEKQDPNNFMKRLVEQHGLSYVLSTIKHMSIIGQSWADPHLLKVIKNILDLHGIKKVYAYPSNIEHCINDEFIEQLRENIEVLKPELSVETDRCPSHGIPETVFLKSGTELQKEKEKRIQNKAIHSILDEFKTKIETIGKHHPQAKQKALNLHRQLTQNLEKVVTQPRASQDFTSYIQQAQTLITAAIPTLERDLSWSDYLLNLIKRIASAVAYGCTLGYAQRFFPMKTAEAATAASQLGIDLEKTSAGPLFSI
ncbi:IQ calmodulin-binding motif-containing protein [Legionella hackeliae]|uniref:Uncharacterized protein n=1 Tax=Legionella hackeliae TaxID=449 RepID=A0A0A8UN14_LEGHA|nr:IQ calmodulin-binding motif-containing protein [Legionella hackeliae]KTD08842.1 LegC5 [Legionella hackeliae]CEK10270.1 protein of unknown function [Legionella hackeliae]STX46999.1 substrate of the Dot/Icm secretion system [Legionella hackeliae]